MSTHKDKTFVCFVVFSIIGNTMALVCADDRYAINTAGRRRPPAVLYV